ncbi:MAG: SDR family oxidoreductase [Gemmatimonadaceae bacterium]|jgi:pteridine reductase|nr:SDR family oxidoreductase [Gemmatimonadaceae bacterium]
MSAQRTHRVALVTGGARRVGRAIALALAGRGIDIAVHHSASPDAAEETAKAIRALGADVQLFPADLRDPDAPDRLIDAVCGAFGRLDILVNSAAIMPRTPLGTVTVEQWDEVMALNLRAPFFLAQAAAPRLPEQGGVIINIADLAAYETWPQYIPHALTKAGVVHMTRGLARALAPRVRVNGVAPGMVLRPDGWSEADEARLLRTTPLERGGSPDDVAQAVLYLIDAGYVTGETILVDGGRHVRT